jgi:serine phosphatase RsbU (regulator of sigma subunit)/anti-sigma regulatory factor (Ser/Thr protein kinase)
MPSLIDQIRRQFQRLQIGRQRNRPATPPVIANRASAQTPSAPFDIAPNDPLLKYFAQVNGAVDVDRINIDPQTSPALRTLRATGVELVVPFINQGEVVALLNLGPRRSEQDYSRDDRALLNTLALQAAPAVRVAQMVREKQEEAAERERIRQEMNVARQIQFELLPKQDPNLSGYHLEKFYEPAQAVGGDFYDYFMLDSGELVLIVGDVSGKGVPAALVMANTRSVLRGAARRLVAPGEILARANDILVPEMPMSMFVTCLCAVLDPKTGMLRYANAGHNPPYRRGNDDVVEEMFARGLPLGILPNHIYEEKNTTVQPGDCVLLYSDGLSEAHAPSGEMFGFGRLSKLMQQPLGGRDTVDLLQNELRTFVGSDWEQEDDITILVLERTAATTQSHITMSASPRPIEITHLSVPSVLGNERIVMDKVASAVQPLGLTGERLEALKTAVAEATMNAIEYGNRKDPTLPVKVRVEKKGNTIVVRITDHGAGDVIPKIPQPDLDAKLAGEQSPRGWGLFLIKSLVDDMRFVRDADTRYLSIELEMNL